MPKILAAFDSRWGDARTNITTFLQLQLQMDRSDSKADGVLNGPTTEAWFDHWYRHLVELGRPLRPGRGGPARAARRRTGFPPPHLRPRVSRRPGRRDAARPRLRGRRGRPARAERITTALRAAGTGGAVAGLDGFTTSVPPPDGPLQPAHARPAARRDPYALDEMGRGPWDRFQTLAGIQYYFDTEFQLVRGHVYYSGDGVGAVVDQPARPVGAAAEPGPRRVRLGALGGHRRLQHAVRAPARRARAGQGGPRLHRRRDRHRGVAADRREPHQRHRQPAGGAHAAGRCGTPSTATW